MSQDTTDNAAMYGLFREDGKRETPITNAPGRDFYLGDTWLFRTTHEYKVGDVFAIINSGHAPNGHYRVVTVTVERVELERVA